MERNLTLIKIREASSGVVKQDLRVRDEEVDRHPDDRIDIASVSLDSPRSSREHDRDVHTRRSPGFYFEWM